MWTWRHEGFCFLPSTHPTNLILSDRESLFSQQWRFVINSETFCNSTHFTRSQLSIIPAILVHPQMSPVHHLNFCYCRCARISVSSMWCLFGGQAKIAFPASRVVLNMPLVQLATFPTTSTASPRRYNRLSVDGTVYLSLFTHRYCRHSFSEATRRTPACCATLRANDSVDFWGRVRLLRPEAADGG